MKNKILFVLSLIFIILLWLTYNSNLTSNHIFSFFILVGWISLFIIFLIFSPSLLLSESLKNETSELNELFELHYKIRMGIVSIFAVTAVLAGIFFQWRSTQVSEVNSELNQKTTLFTLNLSQEKQMANIYSQSLESLSNKDTFIRLGAISSLERLARVDSADYYWPVLHILTAYIKKYSSADPLHPHTHPPSDDIIAILDFLKEGPYELPHSEDDKIDLSNVDLSFSDLSSANLSFSSFDHSILRGVQLSQSNISNASFNGSDLSFAKFYDANVVNSQFYHTKLIGVSFIGANLTGSQFYGAEFGQSTTNWLFETKLYNSDFCNRYDLLREKNLDKCATGLTCHDLINAKLSDRTILPSYVKNCNLVRNTDPEELMYKKALYYLNHHNMKGFFESMNGLPQSAREIYEYEGTYKMSD